MGFRNNSYATVWEVKPQNNRWTKLRISISHKNQDTGDFETDFKGWVDAFGTAAAAKAAKLKEKDRIKLLSVDLTNNYNAEKNTTYWNPKVFEFEMATPPGGNGNTRSGGYNNGNEYDGGNYDGGDDDLPF